MSLILFPQEKSHENLIQVILPLGFGLFLTALIYPDLPSAQWVPALVMFVSVGALFLYMTGVDSILVKRHYRKKVMSKEGPSIENALRKWNTYGSRWHGTESVKAFVEAMIALAVSSTPIDRRLWRIRAYWYFILSYWFYIATGFFYYDRAYATMSEFAKSVTGPIVSLVLFVAAPLGFLFLLYERGKRRAYALYIERDIQFVAEFLYLQMILDHFFLKGFFNPKSRTELLQYHIREQVRFLEQSLVRHDLDLFVVLWDNTLNRLGPYDEEIRRGIPVKNPT